MWAVDPINATTLKSCKGSDLARVLHIFTIKRSIRADRWISNFWTNLLPFARIGMNNAFEMAVCAQPRTKMNKCKRKMYVPLHRALYQSFSSLISLIYLRMHDAQTRMPSGEFFFSAQTSNGQIKEGPSSKICTYKSSQERDKFDDRIERKQTLDTDWNVVNRSCNWWFTVSIRIIVSLLLMGSRRPKCINGKTNDVSLPMNASSRSPLCVDRKRWNYTLYAWNHGANKKCLDTGRSNISMQQAASLNQQAPHLLVKKDEFQAMLLLIRILRWGSYSKTLKNSIHEGTQYQAFAWHLKIRQRLGYAINLKFQLLREIQYAGRHE